MENKKYLKWEIHFGDGHVISNEDCDPDEIPEGRRHNVMVCAVAKIDETGRDCWNQSDFYIYKKGVGWIPVDWTGLMDQVIHCIHLIDCVLQGRTIETEAFQKILAHAKTKPGLPAKSAIRKNERRGQAYGPPRKDEA